MKKTLFAALTALTIPAAASSWATMALILTVEAPIHIHAKEQR